MKRLVLGLALLSSFTCLQAEAVQPATDTSGSPEQQGHAGPLSPIGQLQGLITADDYPEEAIHEHEQGAVSILVTVDELGAVADCVVEKSSGSAALDVQTCRLIWLRARFQPARDSSGKPTKGLYRQRITWRLEGGMPVDKWSWRTQFRFDAKGELKACTASGLGAMAAEEPVDCLEPFKKGRQLPPFDGIPRENATIILEESFVPGSAHPSGVAVPDGEILLSRVALDLEIDEDGKVASCREVGVQGSFPSPPNACETANIPFDSPQDSSGKPTRVQGTLIQSAYSRTVTMP